MSTTLGSREYITILQSFAPSKWKPEVPFELKALPWCPSWKGRAFDLGTACALATQQLWTRISSLGLGAAPTHMC